MYKNAQLLWSKHTQFNTKIKDYKTLLEPILTYRSLAAINKQ